MIIVKPFVTVVVPAKRWTRDCDECLQSLKTQNYPAQRYGIIFVLDEYGSRDEKAERSNELDTRSRVRVVQTDTAGISGARNKGASMSTGDFLAFIDADALASPDWLDEMIDCAIRSDSAVVAGRITTEFSDHLPPIRTTTVNNGAEPLRQTSCNLLCKKSVFDLVGGFDLEFGRAEDYDFGLRVQERGFRVTFCNDGVVYHKLESYGLAGLWHLSSGSQYSPLLFKKHPKWSRRHFRMFGPFTLQTLSSGAVVLAVLFAVVAGLRGVGIVWVVPLAAFVSYSAAYSKIMLPRMADRGPGVLKVLKILYGSAAMLLFSIFASLWMAKGSIKYRTIML